MISRKKIALIKVAVKRLGMNDEDYRALLWGTARVRSSKELDEAGFDDVMLELHRLGFESSGAQPAYGERIGMATDKQVFKMRSLWRSYAGNEDEEAMRRWMQRQFGISHLKFLDCDDVRKVQSTLEKMVEWRKKHPRKKYPHDPRPTTG